MSKKNRAKSKAKRFGEGSAKPIVSAATYGVGGNAFAQAIADPVSTVHSNKPELLVVDEAMRSAILPGMDASALQSIAVKAGMYTLYDDGLRKVAAGVTSLDEVLRATQDQGE